MASFILQAMYFFLPAYASNIAPVIFRSINIFPQQVNAGIFGTHKSWGGLLYGMVFGTIVFYVQQSLYHYTTFQQLSMINYPQQPVIFGFLLASGAILGDLIKSFFKRRKGKIEGAHWFPFDQIDYVIGALLFIVPLYTPPLKIVITLFILAPFLHYTANYIGFLLGLKRVKW